MSVTIPERMEFHVSRDARDRYQFDLSIFSLSGNVIFADFHAARIFAQKMNAQRDLARYPEQAVRAGQINAMGLIDEILHLVIQRYREQRNPQVMAQALDWLNEQVGADAVDDALHLFAEQFPALRVYRGEMAVADYLEGESLREDGGRVPNRQILLEELTMLWLANLNPAFEPFLELFDDADLEAKSDYIPVMEGLQGFFATQPAFGPQGQNLIEMLRAPAIASPGSLSGQLDFIRLAWGGLLGEFLQRLLSSLDFIKEEEKPFFGFGPGPALVYEFGGLEVEPERFSRDLDWMPNLVLMAKNSYVWLDQLSKKYKRAINRLDLIPDEELDALARYGFTGLWLIGLWERSAASRTIKQMRGNPEAVASAYSLFGYDIASDLGGEDAYQNLRDRAWQRGIRLASDMVPNHMGIDSRWVVEHPDWFVSLDYSPFPTYSFNGPNLSWEDRVGIYLEDHYYDNSDAAVVFKRVDFWTGDDKYIYHGNDGTSMPWNDTAQLNYLKPEVREAVIQTILHVARRFPVIRFDAAMTLAKRHYQRLWFPEPGSGGDIPSRAQYGLTKEQFNQAFPEEFWREVVDRVAQEVPDTLLLAEAFWMMEGYFVRTLGMHRVYNSAFMNMLRDEKNQEYRLVIKNTLEFDPEILKRYVNFMNNPDERTAVDQFGKGDKYFGICTLMATMPGLPMFGHGQIEGFTEKYGMEYRRAYWDEVPDQDLVRRHEREIFPLLRRRYLFANASNFLLYDFYTPEGYVNEDVFAYSNQAGEQRALVVYHNKYAQAAGWIRLSAAFPVKTGNGDERPLVQLTLGQGLGLHSDERHYTIFREHVSGLEFIRNNRELHQQGLYVELKAYECQVFLDFRQVMDDESGQYARLAASLEGGGVTNMDDALTEMNLAPVLVPFRELVNPGMFDGLIENRWTAEALSDPEFDHGQYQQVLDEFEGKSVVLLQSIRDMVDGDGDPEAIAAEMQRDLDVLMNLPVMGERFPELSSSKFRDALAYMNAGLSEGVSLPGGDPGLWGTLFGWAIVRRLGQALAEDDYSAQSRAWIDEWLLGKIIAAVLVEMGVDEGAARRHVALLRLITSLPGICMSEADDQEPSAAAVARCWLEDPDAQSYLYVHRYQDVVWFNKEAFESLCWWALTISVVQAYPDASGDSVESEAVGDALVSGYRVVKALLAAAEESGFQVEKLLDLLVNPRSRKAAR
jgi:glycosidase